MRIHRTSRTTVSGPTGRHGGHALTNLAPTPDAPPPALKPVQLTTDLTAVECAVCHAMVKPLPSNPDRPRSHGPGGTMTSPRRGIYKCAGSGNDGSSYAS